MTCVVWSALFTLAGALCVTSKHPSILEVVLFVVGIFSLGLSLGMAMPR